MMHSQFVEAFVWIAIAEILTPMISLPIYRLYRYTMRRKGNGHAER